MLCIEKNFEIKNNNTVDKVWIVTIGYNCKGDILRKRYFEKN